MSYVLHRQALVASNDQRPSGARLRVSLPCSTAPLGGVVLMALLAVLSGPSAASAEVGEAERALLGVVSTQAAAIRGNVEAVARPSLSGGEAALLGKGGGILLASPSAEPGAVAFGDGARALLHHGPSALDTAFGRLTGTAWVPADSQE